MELVQKNIHFNRIIKEAGNQITLEEDVNIPDTKEDVEEILFTKNNVIIEEVKSAEQKVHIRGKILYSVLYKSEETGRLCSLSGSVPINEQLYMEGVSPSDKFSVKTQVEDFSVGIINSRKISIQSVLALQVYVQDMYDEQITTDVNEEGCEILQKECDFTQLAVCKKDILRLRENVSLPNNMPNVEDIAFSNLRLCDIEYKPLDGQISVQGKVEFFILYDGERDSRNQMYQTTIPFGMMMECNGSRLNMVSQIFHEVLDEQVHLETDFDGETRSFLVELTMELDMKLYEPQKVNVLWDLYGTQSDLKPVIRDFYYDVLCGQSSGNIKVTDKIQISTPGNVGKQVLCRSGEAVLEKCEVTENKIDIKGMVSCRVLYEADGDNKEFGCEQVMIPFVKTIEGNYNIDSVHCSVRLKCTDMRTTFDMDGNMDVATDVNYNLLIFEKMPGRNIVAVETKEMDAERCNNLPAMAVCFASSEDTLWEMGKRYSVPIKQIKEMNQLSTDELREGEKILIVRGMCS